MAKKKPLKFKKVTEFKFGDITYKLRWKRGKFKLENGKKGHHRAETEHPLSKLNCKALPEIRISPDAYSTQLSLLQTLIDESLHCYPELSGIENSIIDIISDNIGELLYKVGFKIQEDSKD